MAGKHGDERSTTTKRAPELWKIRTATTTYTVGRTNERCGVWTFRRASVHNMCNVSAATRVIYSLGFEARSVGVRAARGRNLLSWTANRAGQVGSWHRVCCYERQITRDCRKQLYTVRCTRARGVFPRQPYFERMFPKPIALCRPVETEVRTATAVYSI